MTLEMDVAQSMAGSLFIAVLLAVLHFSGPGIRKLPLVPEPATGAFAGGLAVTYVSPFLPGSSRDSLLCGPPGSHYGTE